MNITKTRIGVYVYPKMYAELVEYGEEHGAKNMSDAIISIIKEHRRFQVIVKRLYEERDKQMQKTFELEKEQNEIKAE